MTWFHTFETVAQDVRYAVRTLRRSPGFTVTSIAVLALAIGANTAMFSVLSAVFQPLPYRSPEQLTMLWSEIPSQNVREGRTAYWNVEQWRNQSKSFSDIAFFDGVSVTLTTADRADKISAVRHSPNLFPLLGVQPIHGRIFTTEEAEQRQRLAVISYRFWQTHFGGSPDAIGATIEIDGAASQVIGILPADFQFLQETADVWEPHTMFRDWETQRRTQGSGSWTVIGRLRSNVTLEQAQAEMNSIARGLDDQLPAAARNLGVSVVPLSLQVTGQKARLALWMFTGAIFCVLLIAATNIAGLSLARSASREREIAIRAALGAGKARIIRQLLIESLTLAVAAGLLGLFVADAGIQLIRAFKPADLARLNAIQLDPWALGGALALCLLTGVFVGFAPAFTAVRQSLRTSERGSKATRKIRHALVITEFALAIVLLAGAGLLIRSLQSAKNVDLGFQPQRVLSLQVSTPPLMPIAQRTAFYRRVLEQIESLPGVESAGTIENFFIGGNSAQTVTAEGEARTISERLRFRNDVISADFFRTLGVPLLRGRFFSDGDGAASQRVAIVNDAMARHLWPDRDPIGKRFKLGDENSQTPWMTVVGVVGDMRRQGLENQPIPQMFEPLAQDPSRLATLLVKTSLDDPSKMAGTIRSAMNQAEKHAPVYGITTLENRLGAFLAQRRFQTSLLVGFSAIALLMAAIGIYGLIQYSMTMRTQEIGIRMAIGAQAGEIFRMMIGEGMKLTLIGLAIGLIGALSLGQIGASLLFGVSATDPVTLIAVSLLLIAVVATACYFPARRAMKVDPIVALRQE